MSEWLLKFSEWCQQAWVYIPAVLSFITAIGLPSLVQIAKIFKSAKLYLTQTKSIMGKFKEVVKVVKQLIEFIKTLRGDIEQFLKDEIDYGLRPVGYDYEVFAAGEALQGVVYYKCDRYKAQHREQPCAHVDGEEGRHADDYVHVQQRPSDVGVSVLAQDKGQYVRAARRCVRVEDHGLAYAGDEYGAAKLQEGLIRERFFYRKDILEHIDEA